VSFGVAPSFIVFHLLKDALALAPEQGFTNGNLILAIPFLIAVFSALRLAIFNIDTRQTTSFIGLPTPANAIFIVGVVLGLNSSYSGLFEPLTTSPVAIIAMVLVLSALLVAPIPMFSLKVKKNDMGIGLWKQILLMVISAIAIILMGLASVAVIILAYILLSIVNNVFVKFKKRESDYH
jgi:CDP-diacylglycerol--serine O-phosphatidyltransferase